MNKTRHHTFNVGRAGSGSINMQNGVLEFKHETILPVSNIFQIGVLHSYNSAQTANSTTDSWFGKKFKIELNPKYDASDDFYKNKVRVDFYATDKIQKISSRLTGQQLMDFVYDSAGRLKSIDYPSTSATNKKQVKFEYDASGQLTAIEYEDGTKTYFSYANGNLNKIVSPAKTGVQMEYYYVDYVYKVKSIENISCMKSVTPNNVDFSNLSTPHDTDNQFIFIYDSNLTTKEDVKKGILFKYKFLKGSDWQHGLIEEEIWVDGIFKNKATFSRVSSEDKGTGQETETAVYNVGKQNQVAVFSTYDYLDGSLNWYKQQRDSHFNEINNGEIGDLVNSTLEKTTEYDIINGKITVEYITQTLSKNNVIFSTKTSRTNYAYYNSDLNYGKLFTVEHAANYVHGGYNEYSVQQYFYDANGNPSFVEIYSSADTTVRIRQNFESNSYNQTTGQFDELNNKDTINYVNNSSVIKEIVHSNGSKTKFDINTNSFQIEACRSYESQGINALAETTFGYQGEYLIGLTDGCSSFDFEHYGKSGSLKAEQNIKWEGANYRTEYQEQPAPANDKRILSSTTTQSFAGFEQLKSVKTDSELNLYYSKRNEAEALITNRYNADSGELLTSEDHIAKLTTNYKYDSQGNCIASSNQKVKTATSINSQGKLTGVKFEVEELGIAHEYAYNEALRSTSLTLPTNAVETVQTDRLGRISQIITTKATGNQTFIYEKTSQSGGSYQANGTYHSNVVGRISDSVCNTDFSYDTRGNISEIKENGVLKIKYTYDGLNRLIREDNAKLNETYCFTYDKSGNLAGKEIYPFSFYSLTSGTAIPYTYNSGFRQRLNSFNGQSFVYDFAGKPTTYRDKPATWSHVRNLRSLGDVQFEYNGSGMRASKTQGENSSKFYWAGEKLLAEKVAKKVITQTTVKKLNISIPTFCGDTGDSEYFTQAKPEITELSHVTNITYLYGVNGITGFTVDGTSYYYRKNLFGDITHIYDANGVLKAEYTYDAWGSHKIITNIDNIADINPFRYRSYYFDTETGLYYLKTRYYDPEVGRFINMDAIENLNPYEINGINLFAYCLNNPIKYIDSNGMYPIKNTGFASSPYGEEFINPINPVDDVIRRLYEADPINRKIWGFNNGHYSLNWGNYYLNTFESTSTSFYLLKSEFTVLNVMYPLKGNNNLFFNFGEASYGVGINLSSKIYEFGLQATAASIGFNTKNFGAALLIGSIGASFDLDKNKRKITISASFLFGFKITFRY